MGVQVWYDRHMEVDHTDVVKEMHSAASKGEAYWYWHTAGWEHLHSYLHRVMHDNTRVGTRVHKKLQGDLQNNNFGGAHVSALDKPSVFGSLAPCAFLTPCECLESEHGCTFGSWGFCSC